MTVSELEQYTRRVLDDGDDEIGCLMLDLVADWKVMRETFEVIAEPSGALHGAAHDYEVAARDVLRALRLKP